MAFATVCGDTEVRTFAQNGALTLVSQCVGVERIAHGLERSFVSTPVDVQQAHAVDRVGDIIHFDVAVLALFSDVQKLAVLAA